MFRLTLLWSGADSGRAVSPTRYPISAVSAFAGSETGEARILLAGGVFVFVFTRPSWEASPIASSHLSMKRIANLVEFIYSSTAMSLAVAVRFHEVGRYATSQTSDTLSDPCTILFITYG